jgi:hypothetical protein
MSSFVVYIHRLLSPNKFHVDVVLLFYVRPVEISLSMYVLYQVDVALMFYVHPVEISLSLYVPSLS